jgi:uncharacterized protein YbgA (DUF1722 family)
VKVYDTDNVPVPTGIGLFALVFMEHFPLLPVIDDGGLHDARQRENFIDSIFTLQRWRDVLAGGATIADLEAFHSRHKLLLLAHSEKHCREMGRLVAQAMDLAPDELLRRYQDLLLGALRLRATPARNVNVMQHIMGYFKQQLPADDKQELLELLQRYRDGLLPLIVPITLLNHYVRKYRQEYLLSQYYLQPQPLELQLRHHPDVR